jgi:hypothetical protein
MIRPGRCPICLREWLHRRMGRGEDTRPIQHVLRVLT